MNSFGRHTYYQAQEIKPGSLYLANRGEEVQLVLGVQPVINGDNTGILILKRISGSSFSSDFIAITGERFVHQSQFMLIRDCMLVPTNDVTQWKMTPNESAPVGAIYSKNGTMFFAARNADGERLLINCDNGEVVMPNLNRCFWTLAWEIKQQNEEGSGVRSYRDGDPVVLLTYRTPPMRLALALAALVVAAGPAHAELSFVGVGQQGVLNATFVGCQEQADEDRFKSLVREGDKTAAVKFSDQRGDACTRLSPGMVGTVEDLSVFHGTSCLRLHGQPQCIWVPTDFVGKVK